MNEKNEAAEELYDLIEGARAARTPLQRETYQAMTRLHREALAAERQITIGRMGPKIRRDERRATVERIGLRVLPLLLPDDQRKVRIILGEEAAR